MPIRTIPNQPIVLLPYNEPRQCQVGDDVCIMVQPLDPFRMQFKQTSFGLSPGNCAPQFQTLSAELLTNPDFSGSSTGWILTNATYGSGKVCFNGTPTASIKQTITLDAARMYKFLFEVTGITTGSMTLSAGGTSLMTITADGIYTIYTHPGLFNDIEFSTADSCDGCLESTSLKEFFPCWLYNNTDFAILFNTDTFGYKIQHTPGNATTFTAANSLLQGGFYECKIKVSGRTAGSIQMFAGDLDAISTPIITNGTFTQYLTGNQTGAAAGDPIDFFFTMDSDFDGTVETVYTYVLRTDFIATLLDTDGVPVANLSNKLVYNDDYVTLSFAGLQAIAGFDGNPVPYGCYKVSVIDRNGTSYTTDGAFDDSDPGQTNWSEDNYFVDGIYGGSANATSDGSAVGTSSIWQSNPGYVTGKWYVLALKYKANFIDANTELQIFVGATNVDTITGFTAIWQNYVSAPFQIVSAAGLTQLTAILGDDTAGNQISIDDVQIYAVDQYVSNCISYQASFPGTHLIVGRSNFINSGEGTRYGFGFLFQPRNLYVFFFIMRLKLAFRKPSYPSQYIDGEYSTGRHYKSFAATQKIFEVVFEPTGEVQHDCIAVTIQCPTLYIQGVDGVWFSEANRYNCITEKYIPEYDELGANKLAPSIIQVQHIADIVKISNV